MVHYTCIIPAFHIKINWEFWLHCHIAIQHMKENKQAKLQSSSTNSFLIIGILSATRNLNDF